MDHDEPLPAEIDLLDEDIVNVLKHGAKGTGKGSQFTRRQLLNRSDWEGDNGWKASECKQLDDMELDNMYGPPVFPPKGATILQTIWSYIEKTDKKEISHLL